MRRLALHVAVIACLLGPLAAYGEELAENLPPVPNGDSATVTAGRSVVIPVLANDTDDGLAGPLVVVGVSGDPRASYDADSVTFAASPMDSGPATFTYDVSDGELVATGSVTVSINALPAGVSLQVSRTVVALRPFTLRGEVRPARSAKVALQRRVGSRPWQAVRRTTSDAAGRFSFVETPKRLVRLRYRAAAGRVTSPVVSRQVDARPAAAVSGPLGAADVRWSYRAGCPVGPGQLRRISVNHVTYDGRVRRGSVVVAAASVRAVRAMLVKALAQRFPFKQLVPADHFYAAGHRTPTGSDLAAMRADNTSGFNCRSVTGNPYRLSQHSYGNAIDINTVRNPYVTPSRVYPSFARSFLNRGNRREGMLFRDGVVARTLGSRGWLWGARWAHPDYQHFSANGG